MGTVADAKSAGQTAAAAERSRPTTCAGVDVGRPAAGSRSKTPNSCAACIGACFQLQLFWARLGNTFYGPGASPKLLRRTASRAQRVLVLQRATGTATRADSAAVERRSGVLVGASPAAGVHITGRRGDGEPDTARKVKLLDGSATPGVSDLHVRLARFDVNKI